MHSSLFFALRPKPEEAAQVASFSGEIGIPMKPVAPERLHLTLGYCEDRPHYPHEEEKLMIGIGDALLGSPFVLRLDTLSGTSRLLMLKPGKCPEELAAIQARLTKALLEQGLLEKKPKFSPHVTLAYAPKGGFSFGPEITIGHGSGTSFRRPIEPLVWNVEEIALVHSRYGASRHDEIRRWRLESPQQMGLL
jgi:2'-5' RNA ligase